MTVRDTVINSFVGTISLAGGIENHSDAAFAPSLSDWHTSANGARVAFSGRLDARNDLARVLNIRREDSLSDREIVARAFDRWGEQASSHLTGDFAIAIWQHRERTLILAADTMGIHTVYYWQNAGRIFFATSLRSLLRNSAVPRELSEHYLADYLAQNVIDDDATVYLHIRKVPAGHCIIFKPEGSRTIEAHRFDHERRIVLKSDGEYVEAAWDLVRTAVKDRLRGEGPIAIMGSSGLDSACLGAALAQEGAPVHYLTSIPDLSLPTAPLHPAQKNEQHLAEVLAGAFPTLMQRSFRPAPDANWDMNWSAPLELGCTPYRGPSQLQWLSGTSLFASSLGASSIFSGMAGNFTLTWDGFRQFPELFRRGQYAKLGHEMLRASHGRSRRLAGLTLKELVLPLAGGRYSRRSLMKYCALSADAIDRLDMLGRMRERGLDTGFVLSSDSRLWRISGLRRTRGRRPEVANLLFEMFGLRQAAPLGDQRLVEFCLAIPDDQYLRHGTDRFLARRLLRAAGVPAAVAENRRRGYQHPEWFAHLSSVRPSLMRQTAALRENPLARGLLDLDRFDRILNSWPADASAAESRTSPLRSVLAIGLSIGAFITWAQSGAQST